MQIEQNGCCSELLMLLYKRGEVVFGNKIQKKICPDEIESKQNIIRFFKI